MLELAGLAFQRGGKMRVTEDDRRPGVLKPRYRAWYPEVCRFSLFSLASEKDLGRLE